MLSGETYIFIGNLFISDVMGMTFTEMPPPPAAIGMIKPETKRIASARPHFINDGLSRTRIKLFRVPLIGAFLAVLAALALVAPAAGQGELTFYVFGDEGCAPCRELEGVLSSLYGRGAVFYCSTSSLTCADALNILYLNFLPEFRDRITLPTVMVRGDRVIGIFVGPLDQGFWRELPSHAGALREGQILLFRPDNVIVVVDMAPEVRGFLEQLALDVDAAARQAPTPPQKPALELRGMAFVCYLALLAAAAAFLRRV